MTPLPTVIAAINAAMLMMVRTATATSIVRPSSCGREHIRRKVTRSGDGRRCSPDIRAGGEGRRMTARNVANDSSGGLKVILERLATEGVPQTRADRGAARFFGQRHRDYASSASNGMRWPVVG